MVPEQMGHQRSGEGFSVEGADGIACLCVGFQEVKNLGDERITSMVHRKFQLNAIAIYHLMGYPLQQERIYGERNSSRSPLPSGSRRHFGRGQTEGTCWSYPWSMAAINPLFSVSIIEQNPQMVMGQTILRHLPGGGIVVLQDESFPCSVTDQKGRGGQQLLVVESSVIV